MRKKKKYPSGLERGAALVIAIFSLMLISVVATALILTAGTQSAIKSNYKSAMHAFYDAKAGLEEARGRLWTSNPDSNAVTNCVFPGGGNMPVGQVCYIVNGDNVDPRNPANQYADLEYQQEWGTPVPGGAQLIPSTSPVAGLAGPLYKWVRITPKTEASANLDSDADRVIDTTPLFLYGENVIDSKNPIPPQAAQVFTITALAVTAYGSRRMVQYTVAASALTAALPTFPSALTLDGNGVSFTGPLGGASQGGNNGTFQINGNDSPPGASPAVPAIGYTNSSDASSISSASYLSPAPNVVNLPALLQTPSGLDNLVQSITRSADLVLTPPTGSALDQQSLPSTMSAQNPMVVVVNGNFNLHGNGTGYGLLLVTGTLDYDPDASWNGVILVIGKGIFTSSRRGVGVINGAVFVAQTLDPSTGKLLPDPNLGKASFTQTGGGNGIQYSSNWVRTTQSLLPYQVLSFREIPQATP